MGVRAVLRMGLIALAAVYLAIMLYMYLAQRSLQYLPGRAGTAPEAVGLAGVSVGRLATPDGESLVTWRTAAAPGMPTILFFQGNAGELSDRAPRFAYFRAQGFGLFFVSYRGYGGSSGSISEKGLVTDGLAARDALAGEGIAADRIVLLGESLGTGVAVQVAAQREVAAVALEAPYTATLDVAKLRYWWLPVEFLMKDQFLSRDYIAKVKAPLLIQHGDADTIIPVDQGRALFAMANEPKQLVIVPGEGHDIINEAKIWAREAEFFRAWAKPQ